MLVLGLSDLEHDSAAAIVGPAGPIAALEEDKLSRAPALGGLPAMAVDYCLRRAGVRPEEVSLVGLATRPARAWLREERYRLSLIGSFLTAPGRLAAPYGLGSLARVSRELGHGHRLRRLLGPAPRIAQFEHHLCHAASAYYASDFDRALVVTLDESGDMWSGTVAIGEGMDLRIRSVMRFPNSLGWTYTRFTELLGFRPHKDEHKTQWLSQQGQPDFTGVLRTLIARDGQGLPIVDRRLLGNPFAGRSGFAAEFYKRSGLAEGSIPRDPALQAAVARSAQDLLEETVIGLAEHARRATGADKLSVAGGVFLNPLLVRALETRTGFTRVFVQPAAGNAGTALGAAYLARRRVDSRSDLRQPLRDVYLGPEFSAAEMKAVLDNCKIIYRYFTSDQKLLSEIVQLLQDHKTVAWYQGRVEFGFRALGNRTILASPFSAYVIDNLNHYIKHREGFHPFALSVPAEDAAAYFDCTDACQFMASVGELTDNGADLSRFAFSGRRVRVHTADRQVNPRFWGLLKAFGRSAPAPILVNTSFNLFGEPLVCDPREAIRSFFCAGIDALVLGDFLVVK